MDRRRWAHNRGPIIMGPERGARWHTNTWTENLGPDIFSRETMNTIFGPRFSVHVLGGLGVTTYGSTCWGDFSVHVLGPPFSVHVLGPPFWVHVLDPPFWVRPFGSALLVPPCWGHVLRSFGSALLGSYEQQGKPLLEHAFQFQM
jgi:hypothetical protein